MGTAADDRVIASASPKTLAGTCAWMRCLHIPYVTYVVHTEMGVGRGVNPTQRWSFQFSVFFSKRTGWGVDGGGGGGCAMLKSAGNCRSGIPKPV